jgi:hypothetical protein
MHQRPSCLASGIGTTVDWLPPMVRRMSIVAVSPSILGSPTTSAFASAG